MFVLGNRIEQLKIETGLWRRTNLLMFQHDADFVMKEVQIRFINLNPNELSYSMYFSQSSTRTLLAKS